MGAKSTVDMSRDEVIAMILELLGSASDEALADALECLNDGSDYPLGLSNFRIFEEKNDNRP